MPFTGYKDAASPFPGHAENQRAAQRFSVFFTVHPIGCQARRPRLSRICPELSGICPKLSGICLDLRAGASELRQHANRVEHPRPGTSPQTAPGKPARPWGRLVEPNRNTVTVRSGTVLDRSRTVNSAELWPGQVLDRSRTVLDSSRTVPSGFIATPIRTPPLFRELFLRCRAAVRTVPPCRSLTRFSPRSSPDPTRCRWTCAPP